MQARKTVTVSMTMDEARRMKTFLDEATENDGDAFQHEDTAIDLFNVLTDFLEEED